MPSHHTVEGIRIFWGCTIDPEPITAKNAGLRLRKDPATIRKWGTRYQARKLGRDGREVYYDFRDLATIDGCMNRGENIPPTPEDRDGLREQLRTRWQTAA